MELGQKPATIVTDAFSLGCVVRKCMFKTKIKLSTWKRAHLNTFIKHTPLLLYGSTNVHMRAENADT